MPAYEDPLYYLWKERKLPVNLKPGDPKLEDPEERARLARVFSSGLNRPTGIVLPLKRQWQLAQQQQGGGYKWSSGPWPVRPEQLYLIPGDSPVGLRLPLDSLPYSSSSGSLGEFYPMDPFTNREPLPTETLMQQRINQRVAEMEQAQKQSAKVPEVDYAAMQISSGATYGMGLDQPYYERHTHVFDSDEPNDEESSELEPYPDDADKHPVIRTAMCIEPREGRLYVFMPPVERLEDYVDLLAAVEATADELHMPVVIEGYLPPIDHRLGNFKVTPDPGVIEVKRPTC